MRRLDIGCTKLKWYRRKENESRENDIKNEFETVLSRITRIMDWNDAFKNIKNEYQMSDNLYNL